MERHSVKYSTTEQRFREKNYSKHKKLRAPNKYYFVEKREVKTPVRRPNLVASKV